MKPILPLLLILNLATKSQIIKKDNITSTICIFLQGLSDGTHDASLYHMDGKGNWWDGKVSWINKYRNGDPNAGAAFFGSTTIFVAFTDAPNFFNMASHQFNSFSIAYAPGRQEGEKFIKTAWRAIKANMIRQAGYSLMFEFILKPKK